MRNFFSQLFPNRNDRIIKRSYRLVDRINQLEASCKKLSDHEMQAKTADFRSRLDAGEHRDHLLPEAFALVREASQRTLGMRHFDVQMLGGIILEQGKIAEMSTGEGKTLVATLPAYLNALAGKEVHIVTVNDYLAQRDAEWMGGIYQALGLSSGVVVSQQSTQERRSAYQADITYGTNNEFGFDYLRDNMAWSQDHKVQGKRHYALIDEVDSILIDEARTPLIISGPSRSDPKFYLAINQYIKQFKPADENGENGDYTIDEKRKQVTLTEEGHRTSERVLAHAGFLRQDDSLYNPDNINLLHYINSALRAHTLFQKDVDYIVKRGEVVIVDEFTGRTMSGRRWSDGLHQAIEAKEKVAIQGENQTMAAITFQNYFRLYEKLAGMTGTANTEAAELHDIYGLEVVLIPTHEAMIREDLGDMIYLSAEEKFDAIVADIRACVHKGQPVLVGTASIDVSELLAKRLKKEKIAHQVLNAKHHAQESSIIANAGASAAVTIATNMAGRGTDIVLGGVMPQLPDHPSAEDQTNHQQAMTDWQERHRQVVAAGGLHVIGTERHESRRVDNQLRGRSGRQGDPGSSRFYLSMEDNLVRIFAGDKVKSFLSKLGVNKGESIEHPWVTRAIENAQKKVEMHNYEVRKNLLEYDNVANEQRQIIYEQREEILLADDVSETMDSAIPEVLGAAVDEHLPPQSLEEQWDVPALQRKLNLSFGLPCDISGWLQQDDTLEQVAIRERVLAEGRKLYEEKEQSFSAKSLRFVEKLITIQMLDYHWKEHLNRIDYLRRSIGLRSFAQKNPRLEYKREAFMMFEKMLDNIRHDLVSYLFRLSAPDEATLGSRRTQDPIDNKKIQYSHAAASDALHPEAAAAVPEGNRPAPAAARAGQPPPTPQTQRRAHPKLGRNDLCFCGSNKKYKHCHGRGK